MGQIISQSDYVAVRAALDLTLDSTILPDSLIALPIYEGVAESDVMAEDTLWTSHILDTSLGGAGQHVKNAVIYHCAALLALAMSNSVESEALPGGGYHYTRDKIDWEARHHHLDSQADRELEAVLAVNQPDTGAMPTMFSLARGGRGEGWQVGRGDVVVRDITVEPGGLWG